MVGLPLLLGQKDPDNEGAMLVYQDGFVGTGAKQNGKCLETKKTAEEREKYFQNGDPVVTFGENLSYGCSLSFTQAELETKCGDALNLKDFEIFDNLATIDTVGQFGNANFHYTGVSFTC